METQIYIAIIVSIAALVAALIALRKKSKVVTVDFKTARLAESNKKNIEDIQIDVATTKTILERYELKPKRK